MTHKPLVELGEYELNNIYLADCYQAIKAIPDKSIDLIVTDPPYEQSVNHDAGAFGVKKKLHYEQFVSISDGFDISILDEFVRVLKRINIYIWCSKNQIQTLLDFFVTKHKCYWNIIMWHKTNVCPTCNNKYMNDTEYCLFFREKRVPLYGNYDTKKTFYVTQMNQSDKKKFGHSTIKPVPILQNLIINSSNEGDIVLDCFAGSGSTLIGAKNLNRKYLGFEIVERWYEVAKNRLNNIDANGQMSFLTF